MKKQLLPLIIFLLFTFSINKCFATHAAGSDISYKWIGGNQYQVTVSFYRDCAGIAAPNNIDLNILSSSCHQNFDVTLNKLTGTGQEFTYPCNPATTLCNGGSGPGMQQYVYKGNVTLPVQCSDWVLSYSICCRNCAITTIIHPNPCNNNNTSPNLYVEATLDNTTTSDGTGLGVNSPAFHNLPPAYLDVNQSFIYNHGVVDPDGDSLDYKFIDPKTSNTTNVSFNSPYTSTNWITSSPAVSIDAKTGDIKITPTSVNEIAVCAVLVTAYRKGVKVASVIRDMCYYVNNGNPNLIPTLTGINGTNKFTATICAGSTLSFFVNCNDANGGDVVAMSWDTGIVHATFAISGTPHPTGTFSWTPTTADARSQPYQFTVMVRDNACPNNGYQVYSFTITVPAHAITFSGVTNVSCSSGNNGAVMATASGGNSPYAYHWSNSSSSQLITGLTTGTYFVTITDVDGCTADSSKTLTGQGTPTAINSFSPLSGSVGTLVTIKGTNLNAPTAFTIGGASAIIVSNTDTTLVGMVMPGATTGSIAVITACGTVSNGNFTVTPTPYPGTQQGSKLVGTGATGKAAQGYSIALSADGNTAIVGGISDNSGVGAAWIYTRSGGTWSQQGGKLVGTGYSGTLIQQGVSVALSADGNTAVVGGSGDNGYKGAAWVYTRSAGVWTQQGNKLVGTGGVLGSYGLSQGSSVSLSADGNTAFVGGSTDNNAIGAVWIYTRSGGIWTQLGNKLVGTGNIGTSNQGQSSALSADGHTAIVGGIGDNNNVGAAWIFTLAGGIWTQQGNKLVGSGAVGSSFQGQSVSLSADGNTAIIGGNYDNSQAGAAWVFTRSAGVWTQQGSKLVGIGNVGVSNQGESVSLSADGNTAIVGGRWDNSQLGAIWVYTRTGSTWTQQGIKLAGTGAAGGSNQGQSVSLSADGTTSISGGQEDNGTAGAAWVFIPCTNAPVAIAGTAATSSQITANWNAVTGSTGYYLDVSTDISFGAGNFVAGFNNLNVGNVLTENITGLNASTTYYYRVRSTNGSCISGNSNSVTYATIGSSVACPFVGGFVTRPFTIICGGNITLLSVAGSTGNNYNWQISSDNTNWADIQGATTTSYTTAPGDGTTNKFYRLMSKSTTCWNVTSTTAEVDVSNSVIAVTATNITDNSLTLNWSPTGTGNYSISYSGTSSATQTSVTPAKTITGLTAGGTYSITVTQTGVTGCSATGVITGVHTLCAMPTGVTLSSSGASQLLVSWTGVGGADYRVYYRPLFSYTAFFTKDVINASSVLLTKQGANNLYGGGTYEVFVSRLNCPSAGVVGQGTNPTNVLVLPTVACPTPVIDSVKSTCPVQMEVWMHPGSSPTGSYNIYFQRVTPTVLAVNSYGITSNYFTVTTPYSGETYLIAADSKCTGGALSALYVWPGNVTIKPLCTSPSNLVLSNPTCHGFTASWNSDQCISNSASGYQIDMRHIGTINYNSYNVPLPANGIGPHITTNWLAAGSSYQVFVRTLYSCNGYLTYGPNSQVQTVTTLSSGCREDEDQPQPTKPVVQQYSSDNQEVFSLYPNPNSGEFTVDLSRFGTEEDAVRIEVINMMGQTVTAHLTTISGGHMSEFINLPNSTAAGTYIVRLTAGKNVYTTKMNISK